MDNSNMRNFTAPYEFKEFPKWVKLADGSSILVQNAAEEQVLIGPKESKEETEDRDALFKKAEELGLNPHHKAGVDKLKSMIAEAEAA